MEMASVIAGIIMDLKSVDPPDTDTQRRLTPKTRSRIRPIQKLGIDTPKKVSARTM